MNFLLAVLALASSAHGEPTLTLQSRAVQRGEVLLVIVEGNHPKTAPSGHFRGHPLDFFPAQSTGTWLALIPLDLDALTGLAKIEATLRDVKGHAALKTIEVTVAAGNFPVENLSVDQKYVTPPKSDTERIENESAQLKHLWSRFEPTRLFMGRFDAPIPGAATARFGERRVFNGQPRAPHSGMDLKAKMGVWVRAPAAGRVIFAGPLYFSGNTIIVEHGLGIKTLYAHLSTMSVKTDDPVKKGQVIGQVGATGRVTGPHLHWALKIRGARIDPYSLTSLDLDSYFSTRVVDALAQSPACGREDLPRPPAWGKSVGGLRTRTRPLKSVYAAGEPLTMLVEIQNVGKKSAFLDFVQDPTARASVLGFNRSPEPFSSLASSATTRLTTVQVKIPRKKVLCFEADRDAGGPLLAHATTFYALIYGTDHLYASTSTARAGIWRGQLLSPPVAVLVSTSASATGKR